MTSFKKDKWVSYRRTYLDYLQEKFKYFYKGVVLDIGGRDRGYFVKPKDKVEKWIFADINAEYKPDLLLDVSNMKEVESNSVDVVNAIELFEHVLNIEGGLEEIYRVLKKDGILILSVPFMYHIHGDPYDFQRWTNQKWLIVLKKIGFRVEKLIIMGKYFTHLSETIKFMYRIKKKSFIPVKLILRVMLPILNKVVLYDNEKWIKDDKILNNFHNGYFIIAKK